MAAVRRWLKRIGLALLVVMGLLVAYGYYATREQEQPKRVVMLKGQLEAPAGLAGTATVRVFQAWAGAGALRHPLESIAQFQVPLGAFEREIEYPVNDGEGLVVYAWLDADGDQLHCTPTARTDPAGLTQVETFPADVISVRVIMETPCVGPEHFFPR